jgi:hypothetical protein
MSERPSNAAMEEYLGRVQGLVISLTGTLSPKALDDAQHLIDHGEPAEGLLYLAWGIVNEGQIVSPACVETILVLTEGLVARTDFPPDFAERATP